MGLGRLGAGLAAAGWDWLAAVRLGLADEDGGYFGKAAWAVREIVVFECHGCGKKVGCGLVLFALHPPCPRCGAAMDAIGRLPYYPSAESWALAGTEDVAESRRTEI